MDFINLTSHTFQIGNRIIVPSGKICHIEFFDRLESTVDEIPIYTRIHGAIIGIPDLKENTIYIVTHLVRRMVRDRGDLFSPGKIIKFEDGIYYIEGLRRI